MLDSAEKLYQNERLLFLSVTGALLSGALPYHKCSLKYQTWKKRLTLQTHLIFVSVARALLSGALTHSSLQK
jgi:hypothetical protein